MRGQQQGVGTLAGALFLIKGGVLLALLAAVSRWGVVEPPSPRAVMHWPSDGAYTLESHFATWDGAHYLLLSERGYAKGMASCAFYPLYPLLIRAAAPLFGGHHLIAGLALSNLFSLAAWVLFYWLARRRWGKRVAFWALVFLIAFPGSLFFQFVYTESLFLFLLMGLWWALEERRYGWAALCAGLLPLCRGVGAFVALPLAWHAVRVTPAEYWKRAGAWMRGILDRWPPPPCAGIKASVCSEKHSVAEAVPPIRAYWTPWPLPLLPVVGFGVYMALMWHWTGNPFEGFVAQKRWAAHSIHNLWDVPKFVIGFFSPTQWHAFRGSFLDRSVFVLLLYALPVLWRVDKELLIWAYVLGILPAMSGTFTSYIRFASCAFPLFIVLGMVLSRREWRVLRYALLVIFVALHVVLLWRFVNFRWAG